MYLPCSFDRSSRRCTFELRVASLIKDSEQLLNLGMLPLAGSEPIEHFGEEVCKPCVATRDAPLTPAAFRKMLGEEGDPDAKTFTNGKSDRAFVADKYEAAFIEGMRASGLKIRTCQSAPCSPRASRYTARSALTRPTFEPSRGK